MKPKDMFSASTSGQDVEGSSYVPEVITLPDAELTLWRNWLSDQEADLLFHHLLKSLPWQQSIISVYGRQTLIPRLNVWIADKGLSYGYSGIRLARENWPPELLRLRETLRQQFKVQCNNLLANLYRNGSDCMGWHSDDEPELGTNPVIVSLSLGAGRRFRLRHREQKIKPVSLELHSGDLLIMAGNTQHFWQHELPKTRKPVGPRINLTFRNIIRPD